MRLIDADALINRIDKIIETNHLDSQMVWFTPSGAKLLVDEQPTIEPERKKGKWIRHPEVKNVYGGVYIECSECGEKYVVQYVEDEKFCRNCGADMRGE